MMSAYGFYLWIEERQQTGKEWQPVSPVRTGGLLAVTVTATEAQSLSRQAGWWSGALWLWQCGTLLCSGRKQSSYRLSGVTNQQQVRVLWSVSSEASGQILMLLSL